MTFRETADPLPSSEGGVPSAVEVDAKGSAGRRSSEDARAQIAASSACRDQFGEEALVCAVVAELAHRVPGAELSLDGASTLRVRVNGRDTVWTLDRLDARLRLAQNSGEARAELEQWVHSVVLLVAPDSEALDVAKLRLLPKPSGWAQRMARSDNPILRGPSISPGIETVVVLDYPDRVRVLTVRDAERVGRSSAELLREARDQMNLALTSLPFESAQAAPGVFIMESGDNYAAARLLLPQLWQTAAGAVDGPLVVVPATRDTVLFASGNDRATVQLMLAFAAQLAFADPNPVSAEPLRWTPSGFVALDM